MTDLVVADIDVDEIPPERLSAPTLGWYRRHGGLEPGMCDEARHMLARAFVNEARRQWLRDALIGVLDGCTLGADPDHLADRLRALADRVSPPSELDRYQAAA